MAGWLREREWLWVNPCVEEVMVWVMEGKGEGECVCVKELSGGGVVQLLSEL